MKTIITTLIVLLNICMVNAQSITDTVYFNNYASPTNNDLVNHFSNTVWITQDTIHGITGGALNPPNTLSWGNDLIWYCKNYSNVIDSLMTTSVSFKWNSALINITTYDRAAAIFYEGNVANHNYACYLNRDRTVTLITYGSVYVTSPLTLNNGHWYRFAGGLSSLSTSPGDWLVASCYMADLGTSGTANPTPVMSETLNFEDSDMVNSPEFNVRISGAKWGGGEYLDNFTFHGLPGSSNCVSTGAKENVFNSQSISIYPQPTHDILHVVMNSTKKEQVIFYTVTDIAGREVMKGKQLLNDGFSLNVGRLTAGIYLLQLQTGNGIISKRISVN